MERVKNRWEGLQRNVSLTIFLYNPSVFRREGTSLVGEICLLVVYNRFEHRVTH